MRITSKSAAKARAVFNPGTTREQAWNSLTEMFRDKTGTTSSLIGGSYTLSPINRQKPATPSLGDIFKYETGTDTHYVRIVAWNPQQSFAYEDFWRPLNGQQYDDPAAANDIREVTELAIGDHPEALVLDVRHTQKTSLGLMRAIIIALFNSKGGAFTTLSSVLGPASRDASAWAGGWKKLPIDANNATIKPDRFNGPKLIKG